MLALCWQSRRAVVVSTDQVCLVGVPRVRYEYGYEYGYEYEYEDSRLGRGLLGC